MRDYPLEITHFFWIPAFAGMTHVGWAFIRCHSREGGNPQRVFNVYPIFKTIPMLQHWVLFLYRHDSVLKNF
jgi:hypothetical protein